MNITVSRFINLNLSCDENGGLSPRFTAAVPGPGCSCLCPESALVSARKRVFTRFLRFSCVLVFYSFVIGVFFPVFFVFRCPVIEKKLSKVSITCMILTERDISLNEKVR